MSEKRISSNLIGILGEVFGHHYTHSDIDKTFAYADAPLENPGGNKVKKTIEWPHSVNKHCEHPLAVLGLLIENFMEKELWSESVNLDQDSEPEWSTKWRQDRQRISQSLAKAGLLYQTGGTIVDGSATPVGSLRERIRNEGLTAVSIESDRALIASATDPNAAAHYSANLLEACFKAFLEARKIPFNDSTDTLSDLWGPVRDAIGMRPKDLGSNDFRKVASGLNSIVDGMMHLRNKKSASHGKTETQANHDFLEPRHARLAVHAAHTLAAYVIECMNVA